MAIFLAGKAVCYRILAFFCYGKLHFKCESADLCFGKTQIRLANPLSAKHLPNYRSRFSFAVSSRRFFP